MDTALKHRLIGAAVLSAIAIIFLPKLIVGHDTNNAAANVPLTMPGAPGGEFQTKELALVTPAANVPQSGVVGMDASHPAAPAATTGAEPAVEANGQPLPAGVLPAPATSTANVAAPTVAPVANPNAANATAAATPATATVPQPAVAAAPSAPISAASAGGRYVVSLGTYSNAANAQALVGSLKNSQLPAYAEPVNVAGKMQTRVRIGPFAQRGDAEAARLKAQQVRTDMPANVTALDAAEPPPEAPAAPAVKPAAPTATKPASTTASGTPVAADKAATPSPAAAGRGYAVQVSAYRSEDEALTLRNKLRAAGFTAFSEKIQAESGTMYRVRVGPEADRDAADRLRADISAKLGLNGMVVAYP